MDTIQLCRLRESLGMLAEGIDPQTGITFTTDTILNSNYNKLLFKDIYEVLSELLKCGIDELRIDKRKKLLFYIPPNKREEIVISKEPVSVSKLVFCINELVDNHSMKKLSAISVADWMEKQGFLSPIQTDGNGCSFRMLTERANELGLFTEKRMSSSGREYEVVLYPEKAQSYIIDNLDSIIESSV